MNEREFSGLFTGFWRSALPNLETVVRTLNLVPEREQRPLVSKIAPPRRDIVSETAFQLAAIRTATHSVSTRDLDDAFQRAGAFLYSREHRGIGKLSVVETEEVRELCARIIAFAHARGTPDSLRFQPAFVGHGALDTCVGDVEIGQELIEIKCVDRTFRSTDFRQVITYAALAYLADQKTYYSLTLYNPLRGTSISSTADELIFSAGGKTKEEFFHELSYVVGSGEISR